MMCVICGAEFTSNKPNQITCSVECREENLRRRNRENHRRHYAQKRGSGAVKKQQRQTTKPKENVCHNCGKQFTPNYAKEKFCSDKCRFQFFHMEDYIL